METPGFSKNLEQYFLSCQALLLVSLDDDDSIENCSVLDRMVDSMFDVQYDSG